MKKIYGSWFAIMPLLLWGAVGLAQDAPADRVSVPFSDPSRPGLVKVSLLTGGITVKGYEGKEVIVEARSRASRKHAEGEGMKRIPNTATGLTVEEEDNVLNVGTSSLNRPVDLTLQVPFHTSLKLKTVNDGNIKVEQIQGEVEVNNVNGGVSLSRISGSAVAHALNGNVVVTFVTVDPNKPMSFSSLNGNIDVTFPPDVRANVAMKSDQGEIFSDFEIRMDQVAQKPVVEDSRGKGGKYRFSVDRTMGGTINGGGPEIQLKTFNGNIYIRKGTK